MIHPAVASVVMSPVHALFGLHIVRRGLIFIDLAIAQVAALGMAFSVAAGNAVESPAAYRTAVIFALGGALLIALTRRRLARVPHEAIIGIVFAVASAWAILELDKTPHGLEEIRSMLAGSILYVRESDIKTTAIIYGVILLIALVLWRPTTAITLGRDDAPAGWKAIALDFVYYGLLGFVVASSVKIAGVLVVFAWLVIPAVITLLWVDNMVAALVIAIPVAWAGSLFGLYFSYARDWPTGPAIVMVFGVGIALAYLARIVKPDQAKR